MYIVMLMHQSSFSKYVNEEVYLHTYIEGLVNACGPSYMSMELNLFDIGKGVIFPHTCGMLIIGI